MSASSRQRILHALPDLCVLILPFVVFGWLVPGLGGLSLGNDYVQFPIDHQLELQYSLAHGTFPLYCPGFLEGNTCAALTLGQLYHPLPYLSRMLPGYWEGRALAWNTLLRLLELGIAQFVLRRYFLRLGLDAAAAFIASFIAVYNLRMLDMFRYGASLENYTAFLVLCAAIGRYYLDPRGVGQPALIVIASYLLVVGGHPQMMYLGMLGAGLLCLLQPLLTDALAPGDSPARDPRDLARFYAMTAMFVLCGVVLGAPYLLQFKGEFLRANATRLGRSYAWSTAFSDTWGGALNSFFRPLGADVHGAFGGSSLALAAMLLPLSRLSRTRVPPGAWAVWLLSILTFLVSLGAETPLHRLFWRFVPLANSFRVPGRVTLILPILTAFAVAFLLRRGEDDGAAREARPWIVGASSAALLGAFNFWISGRLPSAGHFHPTVIGDVPWWADPAVLWLGLAALLALALARVGSARARRVAAVALCALVVAQTAVTLRYGTWVVPRPPSPTLASMDAWRRRHVGYHGAEGYGLEAASVNRQMTKSILDPELARFYRSYEAVTSQDEAYRAMATRRDPRSLIVEEARATVVRGAVTTEPDVVVLRGNRFNRYRFAVNAQGNGYLSVAFPFFDNFSATVDGAPASIRRANGYELAIPLSAGARVVEIKYASKAARLGVILASAMLALLLSALAMATLKARALRAVAVVFSALLGALIVLVWQSSLYSGDDLGTQYAWNSGLLPDPDNLAFGRTTRMSSQLMSDNHNIYYAGRGVDGALGEAGFSTEGREPAPWWQVELGRVCALRELRFHANSDDLGTPRRPLLVHLVSGGTTERQLRVIDRATLAPGVYSVPLEGVSAVAVRLQTLGPEPFALREVELFEAPAR